MDLQSFKATLTAEKLPPGISGCLAALWYDGKNNWAQAHHMAQDIDGGNGAWVHAYLHRKEGDPGNARYWYNKAGRPMPVYSLDAEWEELVIAMLQSRP